MKNKNFLLPAASLFFMASLAFVVLNALDVKFGSCAGGCPPCLCSCNTINAGSISPCPVATFCGDNITQNPNEVGTKGLTNIGDEECDGTDDAVCGGLGCNINCVCNYKKS